MNYLKNLATTIYISGRYTAKIKCYGVMLLKT